MFKKNNCCDIDFDFEKLYEGVSLEPELTVKLENKVIARRNYFYNLICRRYMEMLPYCITLENVKDTAIDNLKVQVALRNNMLPVIGEASNKKIMFLGFVTNDNSTNNVDSFFNSNILTEKNIDFKIPPEFIEPEMQEITYFDDCQTGNFAVIKNKEVNFVSDASIIKYYAGELAEINASRYSLILQAKFQTVFKSEVGDESVNQMISALYNGAPYIRMDEHFDEDDIIHLDNPNLAQNLQALKSEYQHKITEANTMLGINSLAVDKASGVSDTEAKSNSAYTTLNANIYIKSQQRGFDRINKRFKKNIIVKYDDDAISELSKSIGGMFDGTNDSDSGRDSKG